MDSITASPKANELKRLFKIYISSLVLIYVAASIASIFGVFQTDPNVVLFVAGVIVAVIMVAYQVYMRKMLGKNKEL